MSSKSNLITKNENKNIEFHFLDNFIFHESEEYHNVLMEKYHLPIMMPSQTSHLIQINDGYLNMRLRRLIEDTKSAWFHDDKYK